jgi:flap endonuclease-1
MGVKIQSLIERKRFDLILLNKKIIAIDAPNIIFSLFNFSIFRNQDTYSKLILDSTQRAISYLYGLLYRVNFYYQNLLFPIFCFDGKVSTLKRIESKDYLNDFSISRKWYEEAIDMGKFKLARKISLGKEFFWPNIIQESKRLLNAMGVPFIESPASAESQCAYLAKKQIVDYVNSQDFDSLLFGSPKLIQNLSRTMKRKIQGKWIYKKIYPLLIDLKYNLRRLNITQFQLIDLAILIGTDYNQKVTGIGPKTALELLKKYNDLETLIQEKKNMFNFEHLSLDLIKQIRKLFLLPDVLKTTQNLYWDPPNNLEITDLLCKDHTLNKERVEKNTTRLIKNYHKSRKFFLTKKAPKSVQMTLDMIY